PAGAGAVARAPPAARPQRVADGVHRALRRGPHLLAAVRHRAGPEARAARTPGGLLVGGRLALHLDPVDLLQHAQTRLEGIELHVLLRVLRGASAAARPA